MLEVELSAGRERRQRATALEQAGFPEAAGAELRHVARPSRCALLPQADAGRERRSASAVTEALQKIDPGVKLRRTEVVGPQVGEELTKQGGLAMLFTFI